MFKNTLDNKRYYTLNYFFKMKFGQKVFKVPIDINSTCPNQVNGGCIYCSNKSTASISDGNLDILEQFENGKKIMEQKWPDSLYIPYFQSGTNTYNDKNLVKDYVDKLLLLPKVVGIDIATRPDCLTEEWLDYLDELNKKTFLIVDLGLQSSNNNTLNFINRGHNSEVFKDAVKKLHERNIFVVAHIINGLPYEIREEVDKVIKVTKSKIKNKNITFDLKINKNVPHVLIGDKVRIKEIINNLLSNAFKYTDKGMVTLDIDVTNKLDDKCDLIIKVKDTGKGISKENIDKLFNKFERLDTVINSDIAGTGLGLAITKALVDMMKGKISVISKKDEGSVFEVLIPQGIGNERGTESEVRINYSNQSHNDDIWKDVPEVVISDN